MSSWMLSVGFLVFAVFVGLGCSNATDTKSSGGNKEKKDTNSVVGDKEKKESDPVALLKQVFADGKRKAASTVWTLGDPEHDVRKTDSLVSPYIGVIALQAKYMSSSEVVRVIKLEYAFQDDRWVQKKAEFKALTPGAVWNDMYHRLAGTYARDLAESFKP